MKNTTCKNSYFLGANTSTGFRHCADDVINVAEKLYIIKGGPGTGKSRLMEETAKAAEAKNMTTHRFYCSSDPSSLDGIYISELSLCIIDGTAPHARDPHYPGAVEETVNLSDFWDSDILFEERSRIKKLCDKKKKLYDTVYSYIKASDCVFEGEKQILYSCADIDKISSAVERIFRQKRSGGGYRLSERQTESVGMKGHVLFSTFEDSADKVYVISDTREIDFIIYDIILREAKQRDFQVCVSRDPLRKMTVNAIYLPELSCAFVNRENDGKDQTVINSDRFIIKEKYAENKNKLRAAYKIRSEIKANILSIFEEISSVHFELEDIYIKAMDFEKKEEFTKSFLDKIFG